MEYGLLLFTCLEDLLLYLQISTVAVIMGIVDSISSITMDTPIAMILMFDWTTESDVIECVMEVMFVLRNVGEEFVVAKSDIIVIIGSI